MASGIASDAVQRFEMTMRLMRARAANRHKKIFVRNQGDDSEGQESQIVGVTPNVRGMPFT
jgi:hypothetical protein